MEKMGRRKVDMSNKMQRWPLAETFIHGWGHFPRGGNLLEIFEGDFPVYMHFEDTGKDSSCAEADVVCEARAAV